jgi:hypothetical protein
VTLILIICYSCLKNENQQKNIGSEITNSEKSEDLVFLTQEALLNYRDNSKSIEFPIKAYNLPDSLIFNKVIAYEFDGDIPMEGEDYDENTVIIGNDNYSNRIKKQQELSEEEIHILLKLFTSKTNFGGMSALCYSPKLGFVFYNDFEVTNVIDICLHCNIFEFRRDIPPHKSFYPGMDIESFEGIGSFNREGVKTVMEICERINFDYANFEIEGEFFREIE